MIAREIVVAFIGLCLILLCVIMFSLAVVTHYALYLMDWIYDKNKEDRHKAGDSLTKKHE